MKTVGAFLTCVFLFLSAPCFANGGVPAFINGVDENDFINWHWSQTYYDTDGSTVVYPSQAFPDFPFDYLADKGANTARLRCWVEGALGVPERWPTNPPPITSDDPGSKWNALEHGQKAKNAGMALGLTVFLSDRWSCSGQYLAASRFHQNCDPQQPLLPMEQLRLAVFDWCRDLVYFFEIFDLRMDYYAIGNETNTGFCGKQFSLAEREDMAELMLWAEAGIAYAHSYLHSLDSTFPETPVFTLHLAYCVPELPDWSGYAVDDYIVEWFNYVIDQGVQCDFLSLSFYPSLVWNNSLAKCQNSCTYIHDAIAAESGGDRRIVFAEWAYPSEYLPDIMPPAFSWYYWDNPILDYPLNKMSQANLLRDVLLWSRYSNMIQGAVYCFPLRNDPYDPPNNSGSDHAWSAFSFFDEYGYAKPVVDRVRYGADEPDETSESADYLGGSPSAPWQASEFYITGSADIAMNWASNHWQGVQQYSEYWPNPMLLHSDCFQTPGDVAASIRWQATHDGFVHITSDNGRVRRDQQGWNDSHFLTLCVLRGNALKYTKNLNVKDLIGFELSTSFWVNQGDWVNIREVTNTWDTESGMVISPVVRMWYSDLYDTWNTVTDFSSTQGHRNWRYQSYIADGSQPRSFWDMTWFNGQDEKYYRCWSIPWIRIQDKKTWCAGLDSWGNTIDAVRTWEAPKAGLVRIGSTENIRKLWSPGPDETRVQVRCENKSVTPSAITVPWSALINDTSGVALPKTDFFVNKGDLIHFHVGPHTSNYTNDDAVVNVDVELLEP